MHLQEGSVVAGTDRSREVGKTRGSVEGLDVDELRVVTWPGRGPARHKVCAHHALCNRNITLITGFRLLDITNCRLAPFAIVLRPPTTGAFPETVRARAWGA